MHLKQQHNNIFYGWWIVLGAALGLALNSGIYFFGFGAFFDSFIKEFQTSRVVLSGAYSLTRLQAGLIGPAGGWLVDKFGPRKVMLVSVTLMGGGFIVQSYVTSISQFYVVFILMIAMGSGMGFPTSLFTAVANWFVKKQSLAFGLAQSGLGFGGGLLVPVLSWIIAGYGWRTASQIAGITIIAIGIPIALLMRHKPEQYGLTADGEVRDVTRIKVEKDSDFTAAEALRTRAFWLLSFSFSLRLMVTAAVAVHIMPFLLDSGYPRETAAAALGSVALMSVPGRLFFGWLGDRFTKRYVIAGLLVLLAGSMFLLINISDLWHLFLFIGLYAPAYGGLAILMQSTRGEYFGRKAFGTIMGYMSVITMIGTVAGPTFAGYIWDITGSYHTAFTVFALTTIAAMVMALLAKRPSKKGRYL